MAPRQDNFERVARFIEALRSFFESEAWKPFFLLGVGLVMLYVIFRRAPSVSLSDIVLSYAALVGVGYRSLKEANRRGDTRRGRQ